MVNTGRIYFHTSSALLAGSGARTLSQSDKVYPTVIVHAASTTLLCGAYHKPLTFVLALHCFCMLLDIGMFKCVMSDFKAIGWGPAWWAGPCFFIYKVLIWVPWKKVRQNLWVPKKKVRQNHYCVYY